MSDNARVAWGNPPNLSDLIPGPPHAGAIRLWRIWRSGGTQLIAGKFEKGGGGQQESGQDLRGVENELLRHYARLYRAERRLFNRAQELKPGSGARSVRQLEIERQRLARELHTGAGQTLAAIRLHLEIINRELPKLPESVRKAVERVGLLASETLEQVRTISKRLHPPEWQRLKLETALEQLWELSGVPQKCDGAADIEALAREPDLETKTLLYRAAQEALSNIARHSGASRVEFRLRAEGPFAHGSGRLRLTVRDNGVGFDAARWLSSPARISSGIGLRSIREQAAALGGAVEIESGPAGTTLNVLAPYPGSEI